MVRLPDPLQLCSEPPTEQSLKEADVLLTLVVGAAVQCPQREHFIGSIKTMPVAVQQAVAERIQRVTSAPAPGPSPAPGGEDGHSYVWPSELVRNSSINVLYKKILCPFFPGRSFCPRLFPREGGAVPRAGPSREAGCAGEGPPGANTSAGQ